MPNEYITKYATISDCKKYRYDLTRCWDSKKGLVTWLLLNPSTADGLDDDRTIAKIVRFSKAWDYGALAVVNLFALRSRDRAVLRKTEDPVGPRNDEAIKFWAWAGAEVVCGWGIDGAYQDRGTAVLKLLRELANPPRLVYLQLTESGQPGHPLFIKETTERQVLPEPEPTENV